VLYGFVPLSKERSGCHFSISFANMPWYTLPRARHASDTRNARGHAELSRDAAMFSESVAKAQYFSNTHVSMTLERTLDLMSEYAMVAQRGRGSKYWTPILSYLHAAKLDPPPHVNQLK
jgi:hypothetical protein